MANSKGKGSAPAAADLLSPPTAEGWKASGPESRQEFFLPVSGFIWFYPEEVKVIDHPAFQRLSKIYQLGQAHYVFRGGTHKRIEHVLGAVSVVQRMINAVGINAEKASAKGDPDRRARLSLAEERFVRLGALLHDIGHLASGHTLEDELCLFGKHDEDDRLDLVFNETNWGLGVRSDRLASVIDRNFGPYLPEDIRRAGVTPTDVIRMLIRKPPKDSNGKYAADRDRYAKAQAALAKSASIRLHVCMNMIGNTLCADLLDYIHRDWYHVGKPFEREDRIYQYMEIRNRTSLSVKADAPDDQRRDHTDVFVLNLGTNVGHTPKIRTDGISAILSLLEKRYELAETVLYHKTKLAAGAMLGRALHELWSGADTATLPNRVLNLSDEELLEHALQEASGREPTTESIQAARFLLSRLKSRKFHRAFHTIRHWDLPAGQKRRLTELFAPTGARAAEGANNRRAAAWELEQDFELPPGSVIISLTHVRPKIAEVQIRVNNEVETFARYEKRMEAEDLRGLSGGHLEAQIQRFSDLWRCDFFVDKDVLQKMQKEAPHRLQLLRAAIRELYVAPSLTAEEADFAMERLAQSYVANENQAGRNDIRMARRDLVAARGDPKVAGGRSITRHPEGARTIRSFLMVAGDD